MPKYVEACVRECNMQKQNETRSLPVALLLFRFRQSAVGRVRVSSEKADDFSLQQMGHPVFLCIIHQNDEWPSVRAF